MRRFVVLFLRSLGALVIAASLGYGLLVLLVRPSLERDWNPDQAMLPTASIDGDRVTIQNVRDFRYRSVSDYDISYDVRTYDLSKLDSLWFIVEPFSGHGAGAAHTFLSFGFSDGSYVAISVEIRKEKGESFSPLRGILRQYELSYVIADERDVILLRTNHRKDRVFLYPVATSEENIRKVFLSMLERANALATEPEFYNTLTNTCTTNIVREVNAISPGRIPWSYEVLMPAHSDELAQRLGLIADRSPIEELRAKHEINERAALYADDPDFSKRIR